MSREVSWFYYKTHNNTNNHLDEGSVEGLEDGYAGEEDVVDDRKADEHRQVAQQEAAHRVQHSEKENNLNSY